VDVSPVPFRVRQIKEVVRRGDGIHNRQRRGHPCISVMCNIYRAAELLLCHQCITTYALCTIPSVDKASWISITEVLGYFKDRNVWVLRMVIDASTKARASSPNDLSLCRRWELPVQSCRGRWNLCAASWTITQAAIGWMANIAMTEDIRHGAKSAEKANLRYRSFGGVWCFSCELLT
jgi:hypothetical protein